MTFFVDRSLGRRIVPNALRDAGHEVVVHDDVFDPDENDEVWLTEAGRRGWIVLMKDDRIRYRTREREALVSSSTAAFVLTNANLTGAEQAAVFVERAEAVLRWTRENPGPAIVGVYRRGPYLRVLYRPE